MANLPLQGFAVNQIWLELVLFALDLTAWMQLQALVQGHQRRWEPKRLRFCLLATAARLVRTGRRRLLRFSSHWPWSGVITDALGRLRLLPDPI